jgi:hypothetical protein
MGLHDRTWAHSISGGMSSQAIIDFVYLWHAVSAIQLNEQPDKTI